MKSCHPQVQLSTKIAQDALMYAILVPFRELGSSVSCSGPGFRRSSAGALASCFEVLANAHELFPVSFMVVILNNV